MKKRIVKSIITILILLVCIGAIQGVRFLRSSKDSNPLSIKSSRVKGNPNAAVQVIEYADFRCSHCSHGAVWLQNLMKKKSDKVFLEFRYFPLSLHDGALASRFVECSLRQGKFWEVNNILMIRQNEWMRLANPKDFFLMIAEENNLNIEKLASCWDDPAIYDDIIASKQQGKELGVQATPTYFINGEMFVGVPKMTEEILRLLGKKTKEPAK